MGTFVTQPPNLFFIRNIARRTLQSTSQLIQYLLCSTNCCVYHLPTLGNLDWSCVGALGLPSSFVPVARSRDRDSLFYFTVASSSSFVAWRESRSELKSRLRAVLLFPLQRPSTICI